jgi:hypothetical protein
MSKLIELIKNTERDLQELSLFLNSDSVDDYDDEYKTPLYYATNLKVVKFLLENGANPNGGCHMWRSTLNKNLDIQNGLPIIEAIERRDHDKLRILLEKGADPNIVSTKGQKIRGKFFPSGFCCGVTTAIEKYDVIALKMLFDHGAKSNLAQECNPIVVARYKFSLCRSESDIISLLDCVKLLLEKGVYVSLYDVTGVWCSPNIGLAYTLAKHYVASTIDQSDSIYYSCLHNVLRSRNIENVKFFLLLVKGSIDRKYILNFVLGIRDHERIGYYKDVEDLIRDGTFPTLFDLIDFKLKCDSYEVKVVRHQLNHNAFNIL